MWVSARKTFRRRLAFVFVLSVCVLNVIPRSYVTPRILGVLLMGRGVLLSVMCGWVLYSLLYGVIKVKGGDLWPSRFPFLSGLLINWSCFIAKLRYYFFGIDSYWQGREIGKRESAGFLTIY